MSPYPPLHGQLLRRVDRVLRTLDLVRVADIPVVGLDPLVRAEEVPQNLVENLNISVLTSRFWMSWAAALKSDVWMSSSSLV